MYQLITDEARDRILEEANDRGIYPTCAKSDDRLFVLFDDWSQVAAIEEIAATMVTVEDIADPYTWADYEEAIQSANNKVWRIEWAVGEFGFADQFMPCDHCREAIDMHGLYTNYWLNTIDGSILCYSCLKNDEAWQSEYLEYCSSSYANRDQVGDTIEIADRNIANPRMYDWQLIGYDKEIECFPDDSPHADFDNRLIYGNDTDHMRLYKSAHLIDENVQLLIQYGKYGHSYIYWARFDPNTDEEIIADRLIFDYVIGLVFAKYRKLYMSGK